MRTSLLSLALLTALALPTTVVADTPLEAARRALDTGEYADAKSELDKAGNGPEASLVAARLALETGKLDEAVKAAKRAEKSAELKAAAAAVGAEALFAQGKRDDAVALLRTVEKDKAARRARLLLGEYLVAMGKRADAKTPLMTLIDDYNSDDIKSSDAEGLSYVGRALFLLRHQKESNKAFKEAERAGAKKRVETLLWRADLFLDKYDTGHAGEVLRDAEKLAPNNPEVRLTKARAIMDSAMDFDAAEAEIRRALEVNPSLPGAHFLRAGIALRDLDIEGADKAADAGLAINPADLELLSMKAAIRFLADDPAGFAKFEKRVLELNPEYSRMYQVVGEFAEWEHRYDDIVAFMEKAIQVDSADEKAYAQLGLNLIRSGKEEEGVKALNRAWDKDPFNVRVFNTLNLYEKQIPTQYQTVDGTTFRIRYAKEEKAILERYVPRMLEEAWGSMVKRYGFTPTTPVSIELYADDEHFSVRTSGLPNVGIQGVCFGKTLALMSPHAGPFNWGNVLWHELGHVFAIQLSKNHVPRWFTEGLSEYETIVRRREWQREEDPPLYAALKAGRVPAVASFNRAFTHVDSVEEVTMAYYAASQIVVFMVERYGWDKVVTMLPRWGKGERTPELIKAALGVTPEELDKQYRAWLSARYARYGSQYLPDLHAPNLETAREAAAKAPNDARKQVELAIALFHKGKDADARQALDAALKLEPNQPDALYILADFALAEEGGGEPKPGEKPAPKKDEKARAAEAKALLDRLVATGHDGFAVRMKQANIQLAVDDNAGAEASFEAAAKLDPSQSEPLAALIKLHRATTHEHKELEALRRYVLLEQHDRGAWQRLLELTVARFRWEEAVSVGESALFIDVANPEVHRLYARALANSGKQVSAVFEYNSALVAGAPPKMKVEIYRELAKGYDKLGDKASADKAREYLAKAEQRAARTQRDDSDESSPED